MKLGKLATGAGHLALSKFAGIQKPLLVGWAVTWRCNESCESCDFWRNPPKDLGTDSCLDLLKQMKTANTLAVGFTGGEPLLREDLPLLVDAAAHTGMVTGLNTNGILLPERIDEFRDLSQVTLSLEGPQDIHDRIRKRSSYARVMEAIEASRRRNIPVELSATINTLNADRIDEVVRLAQGLKIPISFQPSVTHRLGGGNSNPFTPTPEAYGRAVELLIRLKHGEARRAILNSEAGLRHLLNWPHNTSLDCAGGKVSCKMDPSGNVYHCGRVRIDRPGMNAVTAGFSKAFSTLQAIDCHQCWCVNRIEMNLLYAMNLGACFNVLRAKIG